jgi:alkylhydroperoxidase family enzyme
LIRTAVAFVERIHENPIGLRDNGFILFINEEVISVLSLYDRVLRAIKEEDAALLGGIMSFLPMTDYESASAEVKREYDDQIRKNGRVTNMKRTLLHNVPAFHAYMEWYTLHDQLTAFISGRAVSLYSYAISQANDCLVCSTFFRKILTDSGEDPDNPKLSETEKLLMDFGCTIGRDPHHIPDELYEKIRIHFNTEQIVLLVAFAGIMAATNLFNTVAKVPLDEVLYDYTKKENANG